MFRCCHIFHLINVDDTTILPHISISVNSCSAFCTYAQKTGECFVTSACFAAIRFGLFLFR